jgi:hypothetical protein
MQHGWPLRLPPPRPVPLQTGRPSGWGCRSRWDPCQQTLRCWRARAVGASFILVPWRVLGRQMLPGVGSRLRRRPKHPERKGFPHAQTHLASPGQRSTCLTVGLRSTILWLVVVVRRLALVPAVLGTMRAALTMTVVPALASPKRPALTMTVVPALASPKRPAPVPASMPGTVAGVGRSCTVHGLQQPPLLLRQPRQHRLRLRHRPEPRLPQPVMAAPTARRRLKRGCSRWSRGRRLELPPRLALGFCPAWPLVWQTPGLACMGTQP